MTPLYTSCAGAALRSVSHSSQHPIVLPAPWATQVALPSCRSLPKPGRLRSPNLPRLRTIERDQFVVPYYLWKANISRELELIQMDTLQKELGHCQIPGFHQRCERSPLL